MATEVAKIHLELYGRQHELPLDVEVGETTVLAMLPPAAQLSSRVSELALERTRAEGREVRCSRGCTACCHMLVPISAIEARHLADVVDAMPEPRRVAVEARFVDAVRRMEEARLLDPRAPRGRTELLAARAGDARALWLDVSRRHFALHLACPFLEDGSCSIYDDRPLTCREYAVTSDPALCATFGGAAVAVDRPLRLSEVLSTAAHAAVGAASAQVPLPLALEWSHVHGATLDVPADGEALFVALLETAADAGADGAGAAPRAGRRRKSKKRRRR